MNFDFKKTNESVKIEENSRVKDSNASKVKDKELK